MLARFAPYRSAYKTAFISSQSFTDLSAFEAAIEATLITTFDATFYTTYYPAFARPNLSTFCPATRYSLCTAFWLSYSTTYVSDRTTIAATILSTYETAFTSTNTATNIASFTSLFATHKAAIITPHEKANGSAE